MLLIDGLEVRDIPGYCGYGITCCGKVWSKPRRYRKFGRWLKAGISSGYLQVTLCYSGEVKCLLVHILVSWAWIGLPPYKGVYVLHKDDNKLNNHYSNLYYGTAKQNMADARKNGRIPNLFGEDTANAKRTNEHVSFIKYLLRTENIPDVARMLREDYHTVWSIANGVSWKHIQPEN
jgi:hypothetical protein